MISDLENVQSFLSFLRFIFLIDPSKPCVVQICSEVWEDVLIVMNMNNGFWVTWLSLSGVTVTLLVKSLVRRALCL